MRFATVYLSPLSQSYCFVIKPFSTYTAIVQNAVAFIRNNSHKRWWKESEHREELPGYQ